MKIRLPEPMQSLLTGIDHSNVVNFYGEPGTGKTNICLLSALDCVKKNGKVVFVDTEGGFSAERLKQLTDDHQNVLKKIELIEPNDFKDQGRIIRELREKEADLIIVDSLVALYRLEYADPTVETVEPNRELGKQIAILSSIARKKKIPVIITAHTFKNWDNKENCIIGGNVLKYWSKVLVFLERTGKMSERKATLVRHRYLPEGGSVNFMIVENGIKATDINLF